MKMRITIDVERADGPLTDADLSYAVSKVSNVIEVHDAECGPFGDLVPLGDGAKFGYDVDVVAP